MTDRHLISVDELRAAGALDVPPAWRKSLAVEREQYSLFPKDSDENAAESQHIESDDDRENAAPDES